jgi:viroplasmin and RNaseH domain-containing protein
MNAEEITALEMDKVGGFGVDVVRATKTSCPIFQAWISVEGVVRAKAFHSLEEAQAWIMGEIEKEQGVH